MFHTKICGVRTAEDLAVIAGCGGDAVGLNFHPSSPRFVDPEDPEVAQLARQAIAANLQCVGVFVAQPVSEIARLSQRLPLSAIQLHGDQPVEFAAELKSLIAIPLIRAIKLPPSVPLSVDLIERRTGPWLDLGLQLLLDADAGRAHGGSGQTLHWPSLGGWAARHPEAAWTLAGGLTPENVGTAIELSRAKSVDTASGVEGTRGIKSAELMRQFLARRQLAG